MPSSKPPQVRTRELFVWLNQVFSDPEISPLGFKLAYFLGQNFNEEENGWAWPSQPKIAAAIGKTERTVWTELDKLEARGYLESKDGFLPRTPKHRSRLKGNRHKGYRLLLIQKPISGLDDAQSGSTLPDREDSQSGSPLPDRDFQSGNFQPVDPEIFDGSIRKPTSGDSIEDSIEGSIERGARRPKAPAADALQQQESESVTLVVAPAGTHSLTVARPSAEESEPSTVSALKILEQAIRDKFIAAHENNPEQPAEPMHGEILADWIKKYTPEECLAAVVKTFADISKKGGVLRSLRYVDRVLKGQKAAAIQASNPLAKYAKLPMPKPPPQIPPDASRHEENEHGEEFNKWLMANKKKMAGVVVPAFQKYGTKIGRDRFAKKLFPDEVDCSVVMAEMYSIAEIRDCIEMDDDAMMMAEP
jgi:hypothetical protein